LAQGKTFAGHVSGTSDHIDGVNIQQQGNGRPLLRTFEVKDMGLSHSKVNGLELVRVLVQQETQVRCRLVVMAKGIILFPGNGKVLFETHLDFILFYGV
jgi:hypothetical protein